MNPVIFLAVVAAFEIIWAIKLSLAKQDAKHLWVSFYLLSIPFTVEKVIGNFGDTAVAGTLGSYYRITAPLFLSAILLFTAKFSSVISFKLNNWITLAVALIIIALINPNNADYKATIAFAIIFLSNILFFKIINSSMNGVQIVKGLYHGFFILCIIQFCLAICFPVLGMSVVTTLFHIGGDVEATRLGTRPGAIGLFPHPGALSLFVIIATSFFMSCYLYRYNKKQSLFIVCLNMFTVVCTFSRTSYLANVIIVILLVFIKKNAHKKIFSIANIFKIVLPIGLVLGWLIFLSPLSSVFLNSDADVQYNTRKTFYSIAYMLFKDSPIVGVGINSHLVYLSTHPAIISSVTENNEHSEFFRNNPIHNIHLIILAETGILGFIGWVVFISRNIYLSVSQIQMNINQIMSLTFIGTLISVCFYGMTGWSPLSITIFPFFLFISFFAIKSRVRL